MVLRNMRLMDRIRSMTLLAAFPALLLALWKTRAVASPSSWMVF